MQNALRTNAVASIKGRLHRGLASNLPKVSVDQAFCLNQKHTGGAAGSWAIILRALGPLTGDAAVIERSNFSNTLTLRRLLRCINHNRKTIRWLVSVPRKKVRPTRENNIRYLSRFRGVTLKHQLFEPKRGDDLVYLIGRLGKGD
jgi:hypothetical protein